jgi:hypothetical protein
MIRNTMKDVMPFNDPHTVAPSLWAWKDAEGWDFECSVAEVNLSKENREGLECYLLWLYRLEKGESTLCNHGRFHRDYMKSKGSTSKFRGGRLQDSVPRNKSCGRSFQPLPFIGDPISQYFMGLPWSDFIDVKLGGTFSTQRGVYRIKGAEDNALLYIGQSTNIRNRIKAHSKKDWGHKIIASYYGIEEVEDFQLKEIENDLIGGYYSLNHCVPLFQFKNLK